MKTLTKSMIAVCLFSALLLGSTAVYAAGEGVKLGELVIKSIPGSGRNLIVHSTAKVTAVFTDTSGKKEYYIGETGVGLGIDFRFEPEEELHYLVFSPTSDYRIGSYAMQGKYMGQKVTAQMGVGGAIQILIGGFDSSFTLQPLAVGTTKGYGVSAGLGYLFLQKDPIK